MTTVAPDGTSDYWSWSSLREIDAGCGVAKGHAFRAFKRLLPVMTEGSDFVVLDPSAGLQWIERWQAAGRLYRGSIRAVLLSPAAAARITSALQRAKDR